MTESDDLIDALAPVVEALQKLRIQLKLLGDAADIAYLRRAVESVGVEVLWERLLAEFRS